MRAQSVKVQRDPALGVVYLVFFGCSAVLCGGCVETRSNTDFPKFLFSVCFPSFLSFFCKVLEVFNHLGGFLEGFSEKIAAMPVFDTDQLDSSSPKQNRPLAVRSWGGIQCTSGGFLAVSCRGQASSMESLRRCLCLKGRLGPRGLFAKGFGLFALDSTTPQKQSEVTRENAPEGGADCFLGNFSLPVKKAKKPVARNCTELHGIARNCTEFFSAITGKELRLTHTARFWREGAKPSQNV